MPNGAPSLTPEAYTAITAYILQSNGGVAGPSALTGSTAVPIGSVIAQQKNSLIPSALPNMEVPGRHRDR